MSGDGRYRERAARSDGVITRAALRRCGLSDAGIGRRIASGELIRRHEGVFQIAGAPWTFRARVRAALLACGPDAFASHRTAAVLAGIRRGTPQVVDISLPAGNCGRPEGVRLHRPQDVPRWDVWIRDGMRMSVPARIICELAAVERREEVEYAIQEAAARRMITPDELEKAVGQWSPRAGTTLLRTLLEADGDGEFSRSSAERALRRLLDAAGLPRPKQNVALLGHRPDFIWPEQRLIVQVDGFGTHGTPVAFSQDRVEVAEWTAAGWRVMRFTARQLERESIWVAVQIAAALRG